MVGWQNGDGGSGVAEENPCIYKTVSWKITVTIKHKTEDKSKPKIFQVISVLFIFF